MLVIDYDSGDKGEGEKRRGSIPKLDPNRYEASKQALQVAMMGRYSSHEGLKPKLVRKQPVEGITAAAVKKRALKKVYKIQHNLELKDYNNKNDLAYSIIYEACEFNATTIITRSDDIHTKKISLERLDVLSISRFVDHSDTGSQEHESFISIF
jgi:hypothetical protein